MNSTQSASNPFAPSTQGVAANDLIKLRRNLWANGYRPIAIKSDLKFPTDHGWTEMARHDPPAAINDGFSEFGNTGILGDGFRIVDIDLSAPDSVYRVAEWCLMHLGDAPIRKRGNAARAAILYRATEGEPGKAKVWNGDTGEGVEVLGHGQQFVAYGTHPTGYELEWLDDVGPHSMVRDDLIAISEDQVAELLTFAKTLVGETAAKTHRLDLAQPPQAMQSGNLSIADVAAALNVIPNHARDYDWWLKIGFAVFAATSGSPEGYELWRAWSARSAAYDRKTCERTWRGIAHNPPTRISAGTLIYYALLNDPTFAMRVAKPPPSLVELAKSKMRSQLSRRIHR